jgi:hypothetical protein
MNKFYYLYIYNKMSDKKKKIPFKSSSLYRMMGMGNIMHAFNTSIDTLENEYALLCKDLDKNNEKIYKIDKLLEFKNLEKKKYDELTKEKENLLNDKSKFKNDKKIMKKKMKSLMSGLEKIVNQAKKDLKK